MCSQIHLLLCCHPARGYLCYTGIQMFSPVPVPLDDRSKAGTAGKVAGTHQLSIEVHQAHQQFNTWVPNLEFYAALELGVIRVSRLRYILAIDSGVSWLG